MDTKSMKTLYFCISLPGREIDFTDVNVDYYQRSDSDFPSSVTMGFRQVLYTVFDRAVVAKVEHNTQLEILGESNIQLQSLMYLRGSEQMQMSDTVDHFICMALTVPETFESTLTHHSAANQLGMTFLQSLADLDFGQACIIAAQIQSPFKIGNNWYAEPVNIDEVEVDVIETKTLLTTHFYYGWLLFNRIKREHTALNLTPNKIKQKHQYARQVIKGRIALLNLERLILSPNRSKHTLVQNFCTSIVSSEGFDLQERFEGAKSLHESFEKYLENYTNLEQLLNVEKTNKLLTILSVGSISLSLFSASFVTIEGSELIFNLGNLLSFPTGYAALGSVAVFAVLMAYNWKNKVAIHDV